MDNLLQTTKHRYGFRIALLIFLVALAIAASAIPAQAPFNAWADEPESQDATPDYSSLSLDELKQLVEDKAAERDDLDARKAEFEARLIDVNNQLAIVEAKLPKAQSRADQAVIDRYKTLKHSAGLVEAVLAAPDFESFVTELKYAQSVLEVSLEELRELRIEQMGLKLKKQTLEFEHASVAAHLDQVTAELKAATVARDVAQRKADMVANAHLVPDGADWAAGEEKFVAAWAPRINAYFEGTPLAGQGEAFAKAAWANQVDPRFSPAISHIESSRGRFCIRPHNAWGWGAADSDPYGLAFEWATWEDAINAHVRGLARGYGYTISEAGAQTYCPSNWEEWYATTVAQMNSI